MNRRDFIKTTGVVGATLMAVPAVAYKNNATVTTISYNILACRGFPDIEANRARREAAQARMAERMALELALYRPDVVTFQESPAEAVVTEIATALGYHHAWFPGGWPGNDDWPGGFPGSILSRFPIENHTNRPSGGEAHPKELFTRHWCAATLKTDWGPLRVFSAHLHPHDEGIRAREVSAIVDVVKPVIASGESLLFQGDLNHRPDGPEYAQWVEAGLVDTLAVVGRRDAATFSSVEPRGRIDYIWAAGPLAKGVLESRVLNEGQFRTNPEDSESFALSDHLPVLARFEVAATL